MLQGNERLVVLESAVRIFRSTNDYPDINAVMAETRLSHEVVSDAFDWL